MDTNFNQLLERSKDVVDLVGYPVAFPGGIAAQSASLPYITYTLISGSPYNVISGRPRADRVTLQIDIYADRYAKSMDVYKAVRDAIELDAYISGFNLSEKDPDTNNYRLSFDVIFIQKR